MSFSREQLKAPQLLQVDPRLSRRDWLAVELAADRAGQPVHVWIRCALRRRVAEFDVERWYGYDLRSAEDLNAAFDKLPESLRAELAGGPARKPGAGLVLTAKLRDLVAMAFVAMVEDQGTLSGWVRRALLQALAPCLADESIRAEIDLRAAVWERPAPAAVRRVASRPDQGTNPGQSRAKVVRQKRVCDPTPSEIRAILAEIRATWDEAEHYSRAGISRRPVEARTVRCHGVTV